MVHCEAPPAPRHTPPTEKQPWDRLIPPLNVEVALSRRYIDPVPTCSCPCTFKLEEIVEVPVPCMSKRPANVDVFVLVTERFVMVVVPSQELPVTVRAEVEAPALKMLRADQVLASVVLGIVVDAVIQWSADVVENEVP